MVNSRKQKVGKSNTLYTPLKLDQLYYLKSLKVGRRQEELVKVVVERRVVGCMEEEEEAEERVEVGLYV